MFPSTKQSRIPGQPAGKSASSSRGSRISRQLELFNEQSFDLNKERERLGASLASFGLTGIFQASSYGPQATRHIIELDALPDEPTISALQTAFASAMGYTNTPVRITADASRTISAEIPRPNRFFFNLRNLFNKFSCRSNAPGIPILLGRGLASSRTVTANLMKCRHLLIADECGFGEKRLLMQAAASLAIGFPPSKMRLVIGSMAPQDFSTCSHLPHLWTPIQTTKDSIMTILRWAAQTAPLLAKSDTGAHVVVIIDELSALLSSDTGSEAQTLIRRICSIQRNIRLHLILATRFPDTLSPDFCRLFPGKAIYPCIRKSTSEQLVGDDSATRLLDRGDFLFRHGNETIRIQDASASDADAVFKDLASLWPSQPKHTCNKRLMQAINETENAVQKAKADAREIREPMLPFMDDAHDAHVGGTVQPSENSAGTDSAPQAVSHQPIEEATANNALLSMIAADQPNRDFIIRRYGISRERAQNLLDEMFAHGYIIPDPRQDGCYTICFDKLPPELWSNEKECKTLETLYSELEKKIASGDSSSRTVVEYNKGIHAIGKKIVEEAAEVWMSSEYESPERTSEEISQLIYHLLVMMLKRGITLEDIYKEL